MAHSTSRPAVYVLAGPNGGGKSSIGGAMIRATGADYYNPDEATRRLALANPQLSHAAVNALAWKVGYDRLRNAIENRATFAFETTLGGTSITELLQAVPDRGLELHIWYVALENVDAHIARVAVRVAAGGHDIPVEKIRSRFDSSRLNLIRLLPLATTVRVFDNSLPADQHGVPSPELLLAMEGQRIVHVAALSNTPEWAKPIVYSALNIDAKNRNDP